ncbi:MAG TPA: Ig-like domain-containing protein [Thermoanaerobaculia bacterium]|nr:Ig-like domain-containing protein [Thermoanaerobaculia bacterium]
MPVSTRTLSVFLAVALVVFAAVPAGAAIAPQGDPVDRKATGQPGLFPRGIHLPLRDLPEDVAATLAVDLAALGIATDLGAYDVRAGRWGSLITSVPLVPGPGIGNTLTWLGAAPATDAAYKDAVWSAFKTFLQKNGPRLGINVSELATPSIGTYDNRRLVHVYAGRVYGGVPVRDTFVRATLNSGNLVLYGTRNWGTIDIATTPSVTQDAARNTVRNHLSGFNVTEWGRTELVIVPLESGDTYAYKLVWAIGAKVAGSHGSWEALIDARSGDVVAFYDRNSYADQKKVIGGIFPVSNDGKSPNGVPDGIEQPGYPMGNAYVFSGTTQFTTNSEGLVTIPGSGPYRTSLAGPFLRIQDQCGAINESTTCNSLDLGTSEGTDCARPANHSAGDTHSARTGFFELNRIIGQAKSWMGIGAVANLPGVGWMNRQFPANMNINNACNAFFSPADTTAPTTGSINFYRAGAVGSNVCRNTGEIPAVFDHEWGHGLDTFDDSPGVSLPGEAFADMTGILRLNGSCFGRGFFLNNSIGGNCTGNGDACLDCTGVREVDWMKRASRMPHDLAWVLDQNPTVPGNCGAMLVPATPFNSGPCQRSTHCEGTIIGESFWDLLKRDLPCHGKGWESPFPDGSGPVGGGRCKSVAGNSDPTMDENSALVLVTRIFYAAAGGVVMGYQCDQAPNTGAPRNGGCNADSWYMNVLAADDDDGNIANGTPHMLAIESAFRRHGISCRVPAPQSLGCLATPAPTAKPVVTATAGIRSATISWTPVAGAAEYWILRTDGVHGCTFGKTRVARIAASAPRTYTQSDLLDGFTYYYSVVPVGGLADIAVDSCAGPVSECASVTPLAPDGGESCDTQPNSAPVANNDADSAPRNHSRRIDVLANDADADFDGLVVTSVTTPTSGSAAISANGTSVVYTPAAGAQIGQTATFDYTASDGRGGSDSGSVTVTIGGDPCVDPLGFIVLEDPAGDALTGSSHDARSASVAQTANGNFVFILKMTDLNTITPNTTWGTTFTGADGAVRFFRMSTANQLPLLDPPRFAYGSGATVTPWLVAGTPGAAGSGYNADGTIRVVVPGSAIGNPQPGQDFTAFVTRIRLESPDGSALLPDNMPNNAIGAGRYSVVSCQ